MKQLKRICVTIIAMTLLLPSLAFADGKTADKASAANTSAADFRSQLDQLLSEHFVLAVTYMMKAYEDAPDADQVYEKLDQNAQDMAPAIASIYGEEAASTFEEIFRGHNDYSNNFVKAAKNGDQKARKKAEQEVKEFVNEFGMFVAKATNGNLSEKAAKKVIQTHEQDVVNTFDYYVNQEYQKAYESFRTGFHRMFDISKALSTAVTKQMPQKFNQTMANAPAADLRSSLNALASEHFALATLEMQKGYNQAEDYDFVTWVENQHTEEFKSAIKNLYGEEAASMFEKVWQQDHINAQTNIVTATLEEDQETRQEAEKSLKMFADNFGAFLAKATDGNMPKDAASEAIWMHEEDILETYDHYVSGDYEKTYNSFRDGYAFMFGIGEKLGSAIVTQMPDKFEAEAMPNTMPDTGMGGASAQSHSISTLLWITFGMLALGSAGFLYRKKSLQ